MTNRQTAAQEDTRYRALRLLEENPDITQREIAHTLGISLGGANFCLRALVDKGFLKIHNFQNSSNKLGYAYLLTPKGIAEKATLTTCFLKRKMQEYIELKEEIESIESEIHSNELSKLKDS